MAMTPGLNPFIRQQAPAEEVVEGEDIEVQVAEPDVTKHLDGEGNVITIEDVDGSVLVSVDGRPVETKSEAERAEEWFSNLVDDIDKMELQRIGEDLLRGVEDDLESRQDWIEDRAQGLKLLGLKIEIPGLNGAVDGAPVEGMSRVRHPLLLEAVLRFQANARSELLPTDGPVKVRNDAVETTVEQELMADALEKDLNHYLTAVAKEYYPDTDRMLFMLGFGGCSFKKVYFCPLRGRPVSETVDADDLIVNNAATTLTDAKRITHRVYMRPSTVKRLQILGVYRDVDLSTPQEPQKDAVQQEKAAQQGMADNARNPEDRDREIYEIYCELDIGGFAHKHKGKETGLEIPYRVTIDKSSREILSIVRNYDEEGNELPESRINFVKYTFVPGMGFYDIGLLHILGNTTNAVTAAWREMLDAGMYANFPGFLMADTGARQNTNIFRVPPGGGALVKTNGMPINQAIMPLPYKEPGGAMMNLVQNIVETGQRVGGTSELPVGEGRADAPVGTTLALIDQATKVLNAVHKRMHSSQAEEFELLVRCFREHPESFWQKCKKPSMAWNEQTFTKALNDCELVPQADPNTASQTQRMMKVMALKQLQAANPSMYNSMEIDMAAMKAMGWSNPEQFLAPPAPPQLPPEIQVLQEQNAIKKQEADTKTMLAQAKIAEVQSKIGSPQDSAPDPDKIIDMRLKEQEMQQKMIESQIKQMEIEERLREAQINAATDRADAAMRMRESTIKEREDRFEAANRQRDRESKERLAAVKLATDIAKNPESADVIGKLLTPDMIGRLESNEPPIEGA